MVGEGLEVKGEGVGWKVVEVKGVVGCWKDGRGLGGWRDELGYVSYSEGICRVAIISQLFLVALLSLELTRRELGPLYGVCHCLI